MNRMMMVIKVFVLCVGLVLVIFLMSRLGSGGLPSGFLDVFGMGKAPADGSRVARLVSPLNWCETRVQELELPGSLMIRQVQMHWMAVVGGATHPLNDLLMEKWFSQYCTLQVERLPEPAGATFRPYVTVKFIKGEPVQLMRSDDGVYKWKNEVFRSSELDGALQGLAAQSQPTTGG